MWIEMKFLNEELYMFFVEELDNLVIKYFYEKLFKLKDLMYIFIVKKFVEERY